MDVLLVLFGFVVDEIGILDFFEDLKVIVVYSVVKWNSFVFVVGGYEGFV